MVVGENDGSAVGVDVGEEVIQQAHAACGTLHGALFVCAKISESFQKNMDTISVKSCYPFSYKTDSSLKRSNSNKILPCKMLVHSSHKFLQYHFC